MVDIDIIGSDQVQLQPTSHEQVINNAIERCIRYRCYIHTPNGKMMYINSVEALYLSLVDIKNKKIKQEADKIKDNIFDNKYKIDIIKRYDDFLNGILKILEDNGLLFRTRLLEIGMEKIK